ncbi:L,D-transpeptidase family protein [Paramaledivibacter caminithermalis]|jgi:lipoprotein-anchoring transpeptidase ErfK/SrfK|uniref:L,D-transpeptidase catalytic domain n=1 Tax=Paramaledivibacter caminithermalis (strain DSM 15212 / CIP 107654 / DViRD3) TaxID=1121301 RepID=A0A1M6LQ37_PARC5|nr:L,D-transpeptidase family protein [Paramaledivibacter caminithermalis]SHJ73291.1 L,D-transpeptidase catalytic domain [Paramaledivibacter caminithermalis DSM 15212]
MEKRIFISVMILLLISGCLEIPCSHADNTLPLDNEIQNLIDENKKLENDGSNQGDIEEDVNASDLKEDEELTKIAEEEHKTEEDTLIPQGEIEEKEQENTEDLQGNITKDIEAEEKEGTEVIDTEEKNTQKENTEEKEEKESGINQDGTQGEYIVLNTFNTQLPPSINLDLKYDKYNTSYDYLLLLRTNLNIREKPNTKARVLKKGLIYEKLNLAEEVKGQYIEKYNSDRWYKVFWKNNDKIQYGYVFAPLGTQRKFQFKKMEEAINKLKNEVDNTNTAYISNYKDRNGRAPLYDGAMVDKYGVKRYQAAPAYVEPNSNSEFRYISDGSLITILDKNNKYYKIRTLQFEGEYWIPKKYVSFWNSIKELTKAVVIDRKNQNQGVFEYRDGKWNLISYVFATTGAKAKYKEETALGYYMAIEKKKRFLYLHDETREIDGYAPYATRFNGGAYIHGVPVAFQIVEDKRVDPGLKEYLYTIGTTPRSHKCVRNYTSHAKFIYDWIEIGKSAVIVIE